MAHPNLSGSEPGIHILLVEDDVRLSTLIQEYLQQQAITVSIEHRGDSASQRIMAESPDLVVLDLMLPGLDGLEICKMVRPEYHGPILMLTARDEDIDQVVGLEMGADDYVTKPVQPRVLLARIRALLRRFPKQAHQTGRQGNEPDDIRYGSFRISAAAREVWLDDTVLDLTTNEFELLWLLAVHAGEVLTRETILDRLRGIDYDGLDRSVDIRISRLRKKLGDNTGRPFRIKTIRGKGYLFVKEAWG
ncbi:MAG TPA: response regulator [Gammaproteobacteria bacterium]|nr:response regulator [Gammaproteobacteria bacterium]